MRHFLAKQLPPEDEIGQRPLFFIQEKNALFYSMTVLPAAFEEIALRLLDIMVTRKAFIFSTDCYSKCSIKVRIRPGISQKYLVSGPATKKPTDFKLFLCNEENKQQLSRMLLQKWKNDDAVSRTTQCETAMLAVDGKMRSSRREKVQLHFIRFVA